MTEYRDWQPTGPGPGPSMPGFAFPMLTPMAKKVIVVTTAVFVLTALVWFANENAYRWIVDTFGANPRYWSSWIPLYPFWQLGTYALLHDVSGLGHLFFNLLSIYFFGTMVEEAVGGTRFLTAFIGMVVVGGLAVIAGGVLMGTQAPTIGNSAAVYGMICAAATMHPNRRVILIVIPIPLKFLAIGLIAFGGYDFLITLKHGSDGVSHVAHLAGGLYGFLLVKRRWLWIDWFGRVQARRAIAAEEQRALDAARMDELLAKISRDGIQSLSPTEKRFLKRASERR